MRQRTGSHFRTLCGAVLIALAVLAGCREEADDTLPSAAENPAASSPATVADGPGPQHWLEPDDIEKPDDFITRITGAPVAEVAPRLDRAEAVYRESRRMIANRAVQLWQEIAEKDGAPTDMVTLLDQLAQPGDTEIHSIGTVVQNYRVLRGQGAAHNVAMSAALTDGGQP